MEMYSYILNKIKSLYDVHVHSSFFKYEGAKHSSSSSSSSSTFLFFIIFDTIGA
jgi:hypothetical protein